MTTITPVVVVIINIIGILIMSHNDGENEMNSIDKFDKDYCDKVCNVVLAAVETASREPLSGLAIVRNREAYSALVSVMAMMLAQSNAPANVIDQFAAHLSEKLVERIGWARAALRDAQIIGRNNIN